MNAKGWYNKLQELVGIYKDCNKALNEISDTISWEGYVFDYREDENSMIILNIETTEMALVTEELLVELINSTTPEEFEKYFQNHKI